jgi:hypothetical protein
MDRLTTNLKNCNSNFFGNIFRCKKRILARLEQSLLNGNDEGLRYIKDTLWKEYIDNL